MKTILSILLLFPLLITAQQFQVFDIDTSEYPKMKAKFYLTDSQDNPIAKHSRSDFEIKENGVLRDVTSVSCPPNTVSPMSIVIAVDVSGSMSGSHIKMINTALNSFISNLEFNGSEIAIIGFTTSNYYISDFTSNMNKILDKIKNIKASGGTDFNSAFITPTAGAILAMDKAAFSNKQIILITDGEAGGNEQQIIADATSSNITISTIVVDGKFPDLITNITEQTGGELFKNKKTSIDVFNALNKITKQLTLNACLLEWESDYSCERAVDLNIRDNRTNSIVDKSIYLSENQISKLVISDNFASVGDVKVNSKKDTTITFSATNKDITIDKISFVPDFGAYSINQSLPYTIKKGESLDINVTFAPTENYKYFSIMHIETSECKSEMSLIGGNSGYSFKQTSINILYPIGGENLVSGDTIEIKWEGVTEYDLVTISYSTNNGSKWTTIAEKQSGNSYKWKVPNTISDKCKVRVDHLNADIKHTVAGEVEWMRTYGGSSYEEIKKVIQTNDGGFLLVGNTSSDDGDFPKKNTGISEDCLILKLDANGNIEWSKTYGGTRRDFAIDVMEEKDGEFTVLCHSSSNDGDVITTQLNPNKSGSDVWVLRLNSNGEILKQVLYGREAIEIPHSFIKTRKKEYIIVGYSTSYDNMTDANSGKGIYILRLDSLLNKRYEKITGGHGEEYAVGVYEENNGAISIFGNVIDSDWPSVEWNKYYTSFRAELNEYASIIVKTMHDLTSYLFKVEDGIEIGRTNSSKKRKFFINDNYSPILGSDVYDNYFGDVSKVNYNGYIAATMLDKSSTSNYELYSALVSKVSERGEIEWEKTISSDSLGSDYVNSIIGTKDQGYVFAGYTQPLIVESSNYARLGRKDVWIAKLSGEVTPLQSVISKSTFEIQSPKPSIKLKEFDLGDAVVGQTKIIVIEDAICNKRKAPLHILSIDVTGGDTLDFKIPGGADESILNYNECNDLTFELTPTSEYKRTAEVTITTTNGVYKDTFSLEGRGVSPISETIDNIDFGKHLLGGNIDTTIAIIKNLSYKNLTITETNIIGPDIEQFEVLDENGLSVIPQGGSKAYSLRFTPKFGGRTSSIIEFHYDGVGSPMRTVLFAEGIGGEVYPQFKDVSLDEVAELQIFLKNISPKIIENDELEYKLKVQFDPTVIAPTDETISVKSIDNNSYFEYAGKLTDENQIASIPMKVLRTTASEGVITLPEFQLYSSAGVPIEYDIEPKVCQFIVKNPYVNVVESEALKLGVSPNVISTTASITVILIEDGITELAIYNNRGRKMEVLISGNQTIGSQDIQLDMTNYQSGRYYLQLTTPTITKTEFIEVIR